MKSLLAAIALMATPVLAHAETLMTCDGAAGTSYTFEGGLVSTGEKAWNTNDGMPKGNVALTKSGSDLDLIITDASGATFSARADGAQIYTIAERSGEWVVMALWQSGLETYYFNSMSRGGEMAVTMTKFGSLISKASVYRAACRIGA